MQHHFNPIPTTFVQNNLGLELLPDAIFENVLLEKLDLSYNKIATLDERIGNLIHLKELDLSNNKLRHLPASLSKLKSLEVLNLSSNKWLEFPEVITQLPQLKILKIKGQAIELLPDSIGNLSNLNFLDLSFNPLQTLPWELSKLRKLKTLICTSNRFLSFPEVLLEMEQLENLEQLDLDFRLRFSTGQLNLLFETLRFLKKKKLSLDVKKAAYQLFLLDKYEGGLEVVFPLLLVNYYTFSRSIRSYFYNLKKGILIEQSQLAILGKTTWINTQDLTTELVITTMVNPSTTTVILGNKITKKQLKSLQDFGSENMEFIPEKTLLNYLAPNQPKDWLEEHQGSLLELLLSKQDENIALALQMAKDNELLDELMTELLIAFTYVSAGNSDLRNEIKEIFYTRLPNAEHLFLPHPNFKFYNPSNSEHSIFQSIKDFARPPWNALKVAHYLYDNYQVAYTYILEYSSLEEQKKWLERFVKQETLYLGSFAVLKELPKSLPLFKNIRHLNLSGCAFRKFPDVEILQQMPNLEEIDLRNNPIYFIPKGLYAEVARYRVLLSK